MRSLFELLKSDSATPSSQQLPFRFMLGSRLFERRKRRLASVPNCTPYSESMTVPQGRRCFTAEASAFKTSPRRIAGPAVHSSTCREHMSSTTAKYSPPCHVLISVMSSTLAALNRVAEH